MDAALEIFARDGYGDAAVDDIARASTTSKGGVYFHFPSKQALFLCLLDEAAQVLIDRVERAMAAQSDAIAKGDAALRTVLHTFGNHRTLARLMLVEAPGAGREFNAKLANSTSPSRGCSRDGSTRPSHWGRSRRLIPTLRAWPCSGRSIRSWCGGC